MSDNGRVETVVRREDLGLPVVDVPMPRTGARYDPEPVREQTRGWLAVSSFLLLVVVVGIVLLVVASGVRTWQEMEGVAASVFPAVMSVVGAILGFYFGSKGQEDRR